MIHFWIFGTPYGLQRGHFIGKFGRFEAPNSPQYGLLVDTAMDFFCCWKNAIMKHPIAQLILGKTSYKKECLLSGIAQISPPPPNSGNLVLFFRTSKTTYCAYDKKSTDDDDEKTHKYYYFWVKIDD